MPEFNSAGPGAVSGYSFAIGGGGGGSSVVTPPGPTSQSVASGTNLSAVTFGSFTDNDGVIASFQAVTTNSTGSASWAGSGLGAYSPTSSAGDSGTLSLNAKNSNGDIVATAIHSYERAAAGGSSPTDVLLIDFEDVTTESAITSGAVTLQFESSALEVPINVTRFSGHNGSVTPTNGQGLIFEGGSDFNSTMTLSTLISPLFSSYTYDDSREYRYTIHFYLNSISYPSAGQSGLYAGVNRGNNDRHNSGIARYLKIQSNSNGTQEDISVRRNTSNSAVIETRAIRTTRVVSVTVSQGEIVSVQDTAGSTAPTPKVEGSGVFYVGSDSVGLASTTASYQQFGLRALVSSLSGGDLTLSKMLVQRW